MQRTRRAVVASTALALGIAALLQPRTSFAADPAPSEPARTDTTAPATDSIARLIEGGKVRAEFRYRMEHVDQDPFADEAYASTLRTRLGLDSGIWHGLSASLEFDNVTVLGDDDAYNSTTNGVTDRPVVADPEYTEVNQAYLQYKRDGFTGVIGRQRIALDNQRFVGSAAWRQNEQTFD
jgi:Alginate export